MGRNMRKYVWLVLSIGSTLSLLGCGDDGNNGGGGSGGSGGTAGSGGTGGASIATVSGVVRAATEGDSVTLAGATVSIPGTSFTTISGPDGSFSIEAPLGTSTILATAPGHWGDLLAGVVPAGGVSGVELEVIPDALVGQVAGALMETADPSKGLVTVIFDEDIPVGGETAELGVNYGFAFVFGVGDGDPVESNMLIADGGNEVIFANVDVSANVMPTMTNSSDQDCSFEFPAAVYPSQAKVITEVAMVCP